MSSHGLKPASEAVDFDPQKAHTEIDLLIFKVPQCFASPQPSRAVFQPTCLLQPFLLHLGSDLGLNYRMWISRTKVLCLAVC